jgi:pseudouridine 5'-phosphatase
MDGLLLNTEELITQSINVILGEHDKPPLPWTIKAQLQGLHLQEATKILVNWAGLPIKDVEYQRRLSELHHELFPTSKPLPGVENLLQQLCSMGDMAIGLATSSGGEKFRLKTSHLPELFDLIPKDCQILGDDPRLQKSKPEPDIYLLALDAINEKLRRSGKDKVSAGECLVFEDSVAGVEAGRRAGMQVVWCPQREILDLYHGHEEEVLTGEARTALRLGNEAYAGKVANGPGYWSRDGWGQLVSSLAQFSIGDYRTHDPFKR